MNTEIKTITINGVEYVEKSSIENNRSVLFDGLKLVMIRSYDAGVFYGYLKHKETKERQTNVILLTSKRVHYWSGAASLSQLAIEGTSDPTNCRIPVAIDEHEIINVIEIITMTEKAKKSLDGVKIWTA